MSKTCDVCRSVLQCSVLQCVAMPKPHDTVSSCVAVCCDMCRSVLQCSVLQYVAMSRHHDTVSSKDTARDTARRDDTVSRGGVLLCGCIAMSKDTVRHDDTVRPRMEKSRSCCPRTA